jgi:hypothetical protein
LRGRWNGFERCFAYIHDHARGQQNAQGEQKQ